MALSLFTGGALLGGGMALISDFVTAAITVKTMGKGSSKEKLHSIINGGEYERIIRKDPGMGRKT